MNMKVNLAGVELKNPVMTASGTFGSGAEYGEMVDLNGLGAVVTKGVANVPWPGNPTPRIAETYGGMINAIGLQNPGIEVFAKRDIPFLRQYDTKIIFNVCGRTTEDYVEVVERLGDEPVDMLEINISCPNVKEGGIAFGQDPKAVEAITRAVSYTNLAVYKRQLLFFGGNYRHCAAQLTVNRAPDADIRHSIHHELRSTVLCLQYSTRNHVISIKYFPYC